MTVDGRLTGRKVGQAACAHCSWRVQHVADTEREVAEFLAPLLERHIRERHPSVDLSELWRSDDGALEATLRALDGKKE